MGNFVRPNQTVDFRHHHVRYKKKKKQEPDNQEEPPDYSKILLYCGIGVAVIILACLYFKYGN